MHQQTEKRFLRRGLLLCGLFGAIASFCAAQGQDVLCNNGNGNFQAEFQSAGVSVWVGASKNGELATRTCGAVLSWNKNAVSVATNAFQVDLDAFGIELGAGAPVAAFQVRKSANDCCREYHVYSLEKPPRLLRTITGGGSFTAADTDLDGRVEIWADDAAAVDGLDGLKLAELDSAPTIVLRFSSGKLLDVSPEFQAIFDRKIAEFKAELNLADVNEFKNSDGKLSSNEPLSAERLHNLRQVKARALEIVWSYLYSGREEQEWRSLAELWPAGDLARIRAAILGAREHGIAAQVTHVSAPSTKGRKHAVIFDAINESGTGKRKVVPPAPILLTRPPLEQNVQAGNAETVLNLIIDSAGKVRSAEAVGKARVDPALMRATRTWKFTPALKDGRAVACRTRLSVSLKQ